MCSGAADKRYSFSFLMKTSFPFRFFKAAMLLLTVIYPTYAMAQSTSREELINVASFVNGAYPYIPSAEGGKDIHSWEHVHHQLRGISHQGNGNDLFYIGNGSNQKDLYYALASTAKIDSFLIRGDNKGSGDSMPRRFVFSVSQSPSQNFQTVAVFDTPDRYVFGTDRYYNFSIPAKQKIIGRYVRVTASGFKHNAFWNFNFSAFGKFNQTVQSRTDFNGIFALGNGGSIVSLSDLDMTNRQKGTDYGSYLILHQKGMQVSGCYVHGMIISNDGSVSFRVISEVIGSLSGKVESNVFRFTRTSAKYNERRSGVMAFAPTDEGVMTSLNFGHLLVLRNSESERGDIKQKTDEGFQSYEASTTSRITNDTTAACTITGKVQFDNVYFNFDSSALASEDNAALNKVVDAAKAYPGWKFAINGYTDSIGSAEYNLKLSTHRAMAIQRYLVAQGVDAARLRANGYGATPSFAGNVHRSPNRRVEIIQQ